MRMSIPTGLLEVRQLWLADLARRHPGGAETVEAFREVEVELAASLALLRLPETAAIAVTTSTGVLPAPASEVADPFLPDSDPDPALAPIRAVARLLDAEVLDAREEEAGLTLERLAHPAVGIITPPRLRAPAPVHLLSGSRKWTLARLRASILARLSGNRD